MRIRDELARIERGFWTGGKDYFRDHLDDRCMLALPDMSGAFTRDEVAATARDPKRWRDLETEEKDFLQPDEDIAILTYEARATRGSGEPYHALVSSLYLLRKSGWKLAFHGQTPLGDKDPPS